MHGTCQALSWHVGFLSCTEISGNHHHHLLAHVRRPGRPKETLRMQIFSCSWMSKKNMAKGNPKYCLHPLPNKYNARIWYTPFKNDAPWSFPSLGPRHELSQTQEGLLCRASCCKTIKRSSWAQHQMVPANILAARKEASNICSKQPGRNFEYLKDRKKLTGHVTPIQIGP